MARARALYTIVDIVLAGFAIESRVATGAGEGIDAVITRAAVFTRSVDIALVDVDGAVRSFVSREADALEAIYLVFACASIEASL
jgi:hypothetical protein